MKIYINAFAYINSRGFGDYTEHTNWTDIGVDNFNQCQWKQLFNSAFDRFGRLDSLAKHVVAAVELLGIPIPRNDMKDNDTAVYIGTELGSYEVDMLFYKSTTQPGGASPKLFSYTLPSITIGEVAIRYNITGPNLCISAGELTGLIALWESAVMLRSKEVTRCITVINNAVLPDFDSTPDSASYALLLSTKLPENTRKAICSVDFDDHKHNCPAVSDIQRLYEYIKNPHQGPLWLETPKGYNTKNRLRIEHRG